VRERAVPVVRVVRVVQAARPVRCGRVLVTTSLWQRGGCSNVAVTSTWQVRRSARGLRGPVRPVRRMRCRRHATRQSCRRASPSRRARPAAARAWSRAAGRGRAVAGGTAGAGVPSGGPRTADGRPRARRPGPHS